MNTAQRSSAAFPPTGGSSARRRMIIALLCTVLCLVTVSSMQWGSLAIDEHQPSAPQGTNDDDDDDAFERRGADRRPPFVVPHIPHGPTRPPPPEVPSGIASGLPRRWWLAAVADRLAPQRLPPSSVVADQSREGGGGGGAAVVSRRKKRDRRPSGRFITGDAMRLACRWVFDEVTRSVHLNGVREWDTGSYLVQGDRNVATVSAAASRRTAKSRSADDDDLLEHTTAHNDGGAPPVRANDTVFVQTHLLDAFIDAFALDPVVRESRLKRSETSPPHLAFAFNVPIVLVTHNSDYSAPWEPSNVRGKFGVTSYKHHRDVLLEGRYPDSGQPIVSIWYAQNVILADGGGVRGEAKLVPLPIGIENRYNQMGRMVARYEQWATWSWKRKACELYYHRPPARNILPAPAGDGKQPPPQLSVLVSFSIKNKPKERAAALAAVPARYSAAATVQGFHRFDLASAREHAASSGCEASVARPTPGGVRGASTSGRMDLDAFLESVGRCDATLAPHGHGIDTHRMWETLYMGTAAITSAVGVMDRRLMRCLPVLVVDAAYEALREWAVNSSALLARDGAPVPLLQRAMRLVPRGGWFALRNGTALSDAVAPEDTRRHHHRFNVVSQLALWPRPVTMGDSALRPGRPVMLPFEHCDPTDVIAGTTYEQLYAHDADEFRRLVTETLLDVEFWVWEINRHARAP